MSVKTGATQVGPPGNAVNIKISPPINDVLSAKNAEIASLTQALEDMLQLLPRSLVSTPADALVLAPALRDAPPLDDLRHIHSHNSYPAGAAAAAPAVGTAAAAAAPMHGPDSPELRGAAPSSPPALSGSTGMVLCITGARRANRHRQPPVLQISIPSSATSTPSSASCSNSSDCSEKRVESWLTVPIQPAQSSQELSKDGTANAKSDDIHDADTFSVTLDNKDMEIYGESPLLDELRVVCCAKCSRLVLASKFPQHLSYCLCPTPPKPSKTDKSPPNCSPQHKSNLTTTPSPPQTSSTSVNSTSPPTLIPPNSSLNAANTKPSASGTLTQQPQIPQNGPSLLQQVLSHIQPPFAQQQQLQNQQPSPVHHHHHHDKKHPGKVGKIKSKTGKQQDPNHTRKRKSPNHATDNTLGNHVNDDEVMESLQTSASVDNITSSGIFLNTTATINSAPNNNVNLHYDNTVNNTGNLGGNTPTEIDLLRAAVLASKPSPIPTFSFPRATKIRRLQELASQLGKPPIATDVTQKSTPNGQLSNANKLRVGVGSPINTNVTPQTSTASPNIPSAGSNNSHYTMMPTCGAPLLQQLQSQLQNPQQLLMQQQQQQQQQQQMQQTPPQQFHQIHSLPQQPIQIPQQQLQLQQHLMHQSQMQVPSNQVSSQMQLPPQIIQQQLLQQQMAQPQMMQQQMSQQGPPQSQCPSLYLPPQQTAVQQPMTAPQSQYNHSMGNGYNNISQVNPQQQIPQQQNRMMLAPQYHSYMQHPNMGNQNGNGGFSNPAPPSPQQQQMMHQGGMMVSSLGPNMGGVGNGQIGANGMVNGMPGVVHGMEGYMSSAPQQQQYIYANQNPQMNGRLPTTTPPPPHLVQTQAMTTQQLQMQMQNLTNSPYLHTPPPTPSTPMTPPPPSPMMQQQQQQMMQYPRMAQQPPQVQAQQPMMHTASGLSQPAHILALKRQMSAPMMPGQQPMQQQAQQPGVMQQQQQQFMHQQQYMQPQTTMLPSMIPPPPPQPGMVGPQAINLRR
ncbi:hypothetical protein Pelo_9263 [Pelomyxa schiedti]|nr:hypothetical protein Pelo_9263 [Pelomyxa schiedti]